VIGLHCRDYSFNHLCETCSKLPNCAPIWSVPNYTAWWWRHWHIYM